MFPHRDQTARKRHLLRPTQLRYPPTNIQQPRLQHRLIGTLLALHRTPGRRRPTVVLMERHNLLALPSQRNRDELIQGTLCLHPQYRVKQCLLRN